MSELRQLYSDLFPLGVKYEAYTLGCKLVKWLESNAESVKFDLKQGFKELVSYLLIRVAALIILFFSLLAFCIILYKGL